MSRLYNVLLVLISFMILGGAAFYLSNTLYKPAPPVVDRRPAKPNFLILSFCSLRREHLPIFSEGVAPLPTFKKFFQESLIFRNAINGLPWSNITNYIDVPAMRARGYQLARRKSLRIPTVPINKHTPQNDANEKLSWSEAGVRNYELGFSDGFEQLKHLILSQGEDPFFISVHVKYLHFPIIDEVNQKDQWRRSLPPEWVKLIDLYVQDPVRYSSKAPLLLTLFSDPAMVQKNPIVRRYVHDFKSVRIGQIYQVLSDRDLLKDWQASPGFDTDLKILERAYYLKLQNLDVALAPILDLYGNKELRDNTIVVLTGDHGESLMEGGDFLHANSIDENQIHFPLAVRVPSLGLTAPRLVDEQYDMAKFDSFLDRVLLSRPEVSKVSTFLTDHDDKVFLRNCAGTESGIRYRNRYKLVSKVDGVQLFDLREVKEKRVDLKDQLPELYFELKADLLNLSALRRNLFACEHPLEPEKMDLPHLRPKPEAEL
ncbi:MAG: sulfatase-like hydrolase/transferase [Bdellovibrionales bacterium]